MKKIKVALIGAGYIANYHARGLQSVPGVEIAVVAALPIESAQEYANTGFEVLYETVTKGYDMVISLTEFLLDNYIQSEEQ